MTTAAPDGAAQPNWKKTFAGFSPEKLKIVLDRVVRLIIDPLANPNEKEMSVSQLQAMLEVDPHLAFDAIANARGGASNSDLEKLKEAATASQVRFEKLVESIHALRSSLTEIDAIEENDRLPETVEGWHEALQKSLKDERLNLAAQEARLAAREAQLQLRQDELNRARESALHEMTTWQNLLATEPRPPKREVYTALPKIKSELRGMLQAEISRMVSAEGNKVAELILARYGSLRNTSIAVVAEAMSTIENLSFDVSDKRAYKTGQLVEGKGIFLDIWNPRDQQGNFIGRAYNVFAAPQNFIATDKPGNYPSPFQHTARILASRENQFGRKGFSIREEDGYENILIEALKNGRYQGEWIIPPREIVHGFDSWGNQVKTNNLYSSQDTGAFSKTFVTTGYRRGYWSCSTALENDRVMIAVDFRDGSASEETDKRVRFHCRPVFLELIS